MGGIIPSVNKAGLEAPHPTPPFISVCRFVDYGCMLIIRSVHFLPDGRSVVDTVGGKRFRVATRGMKDGYSTADIEHLGDARVRS